MQTKKSARIKTIIVALIVLSVALIIHLMRPVEQKELISPLVRAYDEKSSLQVEDITTENSEISNKLTLEDTFSEVTVPFTKRQKHVASLIDEVWGEDYILGRKIAFCESSLGLNLSNSKSSASGVFHMIDSTWVEMRTKMNLSTDISLKENDRENIETAYHLYKTRDTKPWKASQHCWGK